MKAPPLTGPVLRVAAALLLCAACFQAGRWYQELSGPAAASAKADPGNELVTAKNRVDPAQTVEPSPPVAAGDPVGEGGDIITPLNVRDPSALIMAPGPVCPPPAEPAEPEPKLVEPKPKKMREGRLLELLKKEDKKAQHPKRF